MIEQQVYFTKAEAAAYTRLSPRTLDYARERNQLRAFRVSQKRILFAKEDLDRFVRSQSADSDLDRVVDDVMRDLEGGK